MSRKNTWFKWTNIHVMVFIDKEILGIELCVTQSKGNVAKPSGYIFLSSALVCYHERQELCDKRKRELPRDVRAVGQAADEQKYPRDQCGKAKEIEEESPT
jgi:hypothetical protein